MDYVRKKLGLSGSNNTKSEAEDPSLEIHNQDEENNKTSKKGKGNKKDTGFHSDSTQKAGSNNTKSEAEDPSLEIHNQDEENNKTSKKGKGNKKYTGFHSDSTQKAGSVPRHNTQEYTDTSFYDDHEDYGVPGGTSKTSSNVRSKTNEVNYNNKLKWDEVMERVRDAEKPVVNTGLSLMDHASSKYNKSIFETSRHDSSSKAINEILDEFSPINNEVIKFMGSENDLNFIEIEEILTLLLLRLDDVEVYGNDHIRKERSRAITMVKGSLESLRDKAKQVSDEVSSNSSFSSLGHDNRSLDLQNPNCTTHENMYESYTENFTNTENVTKNPTSNLKVFDGNIREEKTPLPSVHYKNHQPMHKDQNVRTHAQNMPNLPNEVFLNSEIKGKNCNRNVNEEWDYHKLFYCDVPPGLQEGQREQYRARAATDSRNRHGEPMPLDPQHLEENYFSQRNRVPLPSGKQPEYELNVNLNEPQTVNSSTYQLSKNECKWEPGQTEISTLSKFSKPSTDEEMQHTLRQSDDGPMARSSVPMQLLNLSDRATYLLNEEGLLSVLDREDVRHRKIAVVSVVGAFRRGKSFLLNFMLRYLKFQGQPGWLTAGGNPTIEGFSWRGGKDRDTTGILMWPEPFLVGEDLAVILLDTQGTFDNKTTMRDNTFIFALSTLVSSVQIFNLSERIQMDDLTNLQYFLEFGRLIQNQCDSKAFQKLIFLVRDWKFPQENQYGFSGGEEVLGSWLQTEAGSVTQQQTEMIRTCFREIACFLMPHPGERVSTDVNFKGTLSEIKQDFLQYLGKFIESVLSPSNLMAKQVGRDVITARDLVTFMRTYVEQLQQPDVQPRTLFESMAELAHEKALLTSVAAYTREMQALIHTTSDVKQLHETAQAMAIGKFDTTEKFGAAVMGTTYRKKLMKAIHDYYERLTKEYFEHKERQRVEEVHNHLENAFAGYQGGMSALLVEADLSSTIETAHDKCRQPIQRVLISQLQPLLSREQIIQELEKLDKKMLSFYNTLAPAYRRRCQRLQLAAQKEELQSALDAALSHYRGTMETQCGGLKMVPNVRQVHAVSWSAAFNFLKTAADKYEPKTTKSYVDKFKTETQEIHRYYSEQNADKVRQEHRQDVRRSLGETQKAALHQYHIEMEQCCRSTMSHPDLEAINIEAREKAINLFQPLLNKFGIEECKPYLLALKQDIETAYNLLEKKNADLSKSELQDTAKETLTRARTESLALFKKKMNNMQAGDGIEEIHALAVKEAKKEFETIAGNFKTLPIALENRTKLQKDIAAFMDEFKTKKFERERTFNAESLLAVTRSRDMYKKGMAQMGCDGETPVLEEQLDEAHMKTRGEALSNLKQCLTEIGGNLSQKIYEDQLEEEIERKWSSLKERNKKNEAKQKKEKDVLAKTAYNDALLHYRVGINTQLYNSDPKKLFTFHQQKRSESINMFTEKTKKCDPMVNQRFLEQLHEEIQKTFEDFEENFAKNLREMRDSSSAERDKISLAVGIDLGTTNSCVAVYKDGDVHIIGNNIGKKTTPSVVFFDRNNMVFGEPAILRGFTNPENCVSEVKRIIGRKFDDPVVSTVTQLWNFKVTNEKGSPVIEVTNGKKKKWRPEEISALVLGEMKHVAEVYLDAKVHDAVVTIPAYFNELQREATKTACKEAGLNVLRMINEPTAAAIAYGIQSKSTHSRTVLVYDFGGGTCDVSILVVKKGHFTVKASQGDNRLGGEDFDDNMMSHVAKIFEEKYNVTLDKTALRRLRHQCERVKRMLTDDTKYELGIENFVDKMYLQQTIQRSEFEEVNSELFTRAVIPVKKCLEEANMKVEDIDEVVLVGGSSRMPKIQQLLREIFNDKELNISINPDEAIAYGAATQAAISTNQCKDEMCIIDITPFSLGTDVIKNEMSIIIPKNTVIPCNITKTFVTSSHNQTTMSVEVYQGENTKKKSLNTMLGNFTFTGLKKAPAGVTKADITFEIDEDGILHVTAKEVSSDNAQSLTIDRKVVT